MKYIEINENYSPEEDAFTSIDLEDTRKTRLTLAHLSKLRKIREYRKYQKGAEKPKSNNNTDPQQKHQALLI
jgi:hypothetical protein